jgi:hypothetical protein
MVTWAGTPLEGFAAVVRSRQPSTAGAASGTSTTSALRKTVTSRSTATRRIV